MDDIQEYRKFTHDLIFTSVCTILLSSAMTQLVQGLLVPASAEYLPAWAIPLIEAVAATGGLYYLNKNGKKSEAKPMGKEQMTTYEERAAPVQVGDVVTLNIEGVGSRGDGIGKIEGFVVMVHGAKLHANVQCKIIRLVKTTKGTSFGVADLV